MGFRAPLLALQISVCIRHWRTLAGASGLCMKLQNVHEFKLTDFIAAERLQKLQDAFAALTGISTSFRDDLGGAITEPANKPEYCRLMRSTPSGDAACTQSHAEAATAAHESASPCRTCCHAGLSQFVSPIRVNERRLGSIAVGDRPAAELTDDMLAVLAQRHGLDAAALSAAARQLPTWSEETMSLATSFVQQMAGTLAMVAFTAYQLQCRIDDITAVHDISTKLARRVDLREILDTALRQIIETMGLKAAAIRLLDEETGVLRLAASCNLSQEYLDKRAILATESEIDAEVLLGKTVYISDLRSDPRNDYPEKAREEGLASVLMAPLKFDGRPIGVLRAYMDRVYRFSEFDITLMEAISAQVAAAIVNARLTEEAQEAERIDRQIKLAADVQRRMFPARPPQREHYEFGCVFEPNYDLGGDFYDFIEFPNGDVGFVIADVVGKGMPASLIMASTRSAMRSAARRATSLADVMEEVNLRVSEDTTEGEFVTAFAGVLSADGKRLRYCNAGHEPLLLLRRGRTLSLDMGGMVLGIDPTSRYDSGVELIRPGDVMVMVTDGALEAMNFDGDSYGRERLLTSVRIHGALAPDMPVDLIAKQILWDVRRFVGLAKLGDDLTVVVIRVK